MSDENNASKFRWIYPSSLSDGPYRVRFENFIAKLNWQEVLDYAAAKREGRGCRFLPDIGMGLNHVVRIIEFEDGKRWVARLRMPSLTGDPYPINTAVTMENEKNVAALVQLKTNIPVSSVHAIETSEQCCVGAPFMLMDCWDGNVGMDLGMEVPHKHKEAFFKKLAKIQVALSTVQLPKIGTILSIDDDGSCTQGPIPGIGGPFDSATEFFRAWSMTAQFGISVEQLRAASGQFASEVLTAVAAFPQSIGEVANRLSIHDGGPFPLCHGDFGHNNIVVNDEYQVLGVIDWENAFAAPWEVAGNFPLTLSIVPPAMDVPWKYDENGDPKDTYLAEKFADRIRYIKAVEEEEERLKTEERISLASVLQDKKRQDLVTAMRLYESGKAGFYSKVVQQFLVVDQENK